MPEQSHKNSPNTRPTSSFQQTSCQEIATEHIPHGQRLHALAILSSKPTLEIYRPDLVASPSDRQSVGPPCRSHTRTSAPPAIQFHSLQPLEDRLRAGNSLTGIFSAQPGPELPAPPTPMSAAQPPDPGQPLRGHSLRRAMRSTPPISQTTTSFLLEPAFPFVAHLATETEQPAQLRHALLGLQRQLHKR